jgi:Flp pilus assembly protein TadD
MAGPPKNLHADDTTSPPRSWAFAGALFGLFVFALALRLGYLHELRGSVLLEVLVGDGLEYDRWARALLAGDASSPEVYYQAPLYPHLLAGVYAAFGESFVAVLWLQAVAGAAACVLLALAGGHFFSRRVGWIAGALLAVYPYAIFYVGLIQKTAFALLFLCALLWLLGSARAQPTALRLLGAGLALGGLIQLRENALVLVPVLALWPLLEWREVSLQQRVARAVLVVLGVGLVLGPVSWRNASHGGGGFLPTTFQLGTNLYSGNRQGSTGRYSPLREGGGFPGREQDDSWALAEAQAGERLTPAGVSDYWVAKTFEEIADAPAAWLGLMLHKSVLLWNAEEVLDIEAPEVYADESVILRSLVAGFHFGVLFPIALWGLCATVGDRRRLGLLYVILLATAASVVIFFVLGRLRFTLVPPLLLFAAAGLAALPPLRDAPPRRWALCVGSLLLGAIFANLPLSGGVRDARAHTYNDLAGALREAGRTEEALAYFDRSIARDPRFTWPLLNRAKLLRAEGRSAEALPLLQRALALAPDSGVVHLHLGSALGDAGRLAEAERHLRRAIALAPGTPGAEASLGVVLLKLGRSEEAIAPLRRAVERHPEDPGRRNNLALALARSGRAEEAKREFDEVRRLDPQRGDSR